ncbi:MAG: hypothetical protein LBQ47_04125, partial [Endomicrobium sp.]|nr:hypothetical protein [Endomicrobium sp.]
SALFSALSALSAQTDEEIDGQMVKVWKNPVMSSLNGSPEFIPTGQIVGIGNEISDAASLFAKNNFQEALVRYKNINVMLNSLYSKINNDIAKSLNSPTAYLDMNTHLLWAKEVIRLQKLLLDIREGLAAEIAKPESERNFKKVQPYVDQLNKILKDQQELDGLSQRELALRKIEITKEDRTEALSAVYELFTGRVLPSDMGQYNLTTSVKDVLAQDYVLAKNEQGESFNSQEWAKTALNKHMREILGDILNQDIKKIKHNNKTTDIIAIQTRMALLNHIILKSKYGSEKTKEEEGILNALNSAISVSKDSIKQESEELINDGILFSNYIGSRPDRFEYFSRAFQMHLMQQYLKKYVAKLWDDASMVMKSEQDISNTDIAFIKKEIKKELAKSSKSDILIDFLFFEIQHLKEAKPDNVNYLMEQISKAKAEAKAEAEAEAEARENMSEPFYKDGIANLAARYVELYFDESSSLGENERNQMLNIVQGYMSEYAKTDYIAKIFEKRFEQGGSPLDEQNKVYLRDYIKVILRADVNYGYKYGDVHLSGFTDFVNWSLNLTATADLKQIWEDLKNKKDEKKENAEMNAKLDTSIGLAVTEAIQSVMREYLPISIFKLSHLSADLSNQIIATVKGELSKDEKFYKKIEAKVKEVMNDKNNKGLKKEELDKKIQEAISQMLIDEGLVTQQEGYQLSALARFAVNTVNSYQEDILFSALNTYASGIEEIQDARAFKTIAKNIYRGIGYLYGLKNDDNDKDALQRRFNKSLDDIKILALARDKWNISENDWNAYVESFRDAFGEGEQKGIESRQIIRTRRSDPQILYTSIINAPDKADLLKLFNRWYKYQLGNYTSLEDLFNAGGTNKEHALNLLSQLMYLDTNNDGIVDKELNDAQAIENFRAYVSLNNAIEDNEVNRGLFKARFGFDINDVSDNAYYTVEENGTTTKKSKALKSLTVLLFDGSGARRNVDNALAQLDPQGILAALQAAFTSDEYSIGMLNTDDAQAAYYEVTEKTSNHTLKVYLGSSLDIEAIKFIFAVWNDLVKTKKYEIITPSATKDSMKNFYFAVKFVEEKITITDMDIYPFNAGGKIGNIVEKSVELFTARAGFQKELGKNGYTKITIYATVANDANHTLSYKVSATKDNVEKTATIYPGKDNVIKDAITLYNEFVGDLNMAEVEKALKDIFGAGTVERITENDITWFHVTVKVGDGAGFEMDIYPYNTQNQLIFNRADIEFIYDTYKKLKKAGFSVTPQTTRDDKKNFYFKTEKYGITDMDIYPFNAGGQIKDIVEQSEALFDARKGFQGWLNKNYSGWTIAVKTEGDNHVLIYTVTVLVDGSKKSIEVYAGSASTGIRDEAGLIQFFEDALLNKTFLDTLKDDGRYEPVGGTQFENGNTDIAYDIFRRNDVENFDPELATELGVDPAKLGGKWAIKIYQGNNYDKEAIDHIFDTYKAIVTHEGVKSETMKWVSVDKIGYFTLTIKSGTPSQTLKMGDLQDYVIYPFNSAGAVDLKIIENSKHIIDTFKRLVQEGYTVVGYLKEKGKDSWYFEVTKGDFKGKVHPFADSGSAENLDELVVGLNDLMELYDMLQKFAPGRLDPIPEINIINGKSVPYYTINIASSNGQNFNYAVYLYAKDPDTGTYVKQKISDIEKDIRHIIDVYEQLTSKYTVEYESDNENPIFIIINAFGADDYTIYPLDKLQKDKSGAEILEELDTLTRVYDTLSGKGYVLNPVVDEVTKDFYFTVTNSDIKLYLDGDPRTPYKLYPFDGGTIKDAQNMIDDTVFIFGLFKKLTDKGYGPVYREKTVGGKVIPYIEITINAGGTDAGFKTGIYPFKDGKRQNMDELLRNADHLRNVYNRLYKKCNDLKGDDVSVQYTEEANPKDPQNPIPYFNVSMTVNGQKFSNFKVYPFKQSTTDTIDADVAKNSEHILTVFAGLANKDFIINTSSFNDKDVNKNFFVISKSNIVAPDRQKIAMNVFPIDAYGRVPDLPEIMDKVYTELKKFQDAEESLGYKVIKCNDTDSSYIYYEVNYQGRPVRVSLYKKDVTGVNGVHDVDALIAQLNVSNNIDDLIEEIEGRDKNKNGELTAFYEFLTGIKWDEFKNKDDANAREILQNALYSGKYQINSPKDAADMLEKAKKLYDYINKINTIGKNAAQSIIDALKLPGGIQNVPSNLNDRITAGKTNNANKLYEALIGAFFTNGSESDDIFRILELIEYGAGRLHYGGATAERGLYLTIDGNEDFKLYIYSNIGHNEIVNIFSVDKAIKNVLALDSSKEIIKKVYTELGRSSELVYSATLGRNPVMETQLQDHFLGTTLYLVLPDGGIAFPFDKSGNYIGDHALLNQIRFSRVKDELEKQIGSPISTFEGKLIFYYDAAGNLVGTRAREDNPSDFAVEIDLTKGIGPNNTIMSDEEAKQAIFNAGKMTLLPQQFIELYKKKYIETHGGGKVGEAAYNKEYGSENAGQAVYEKNDNILNIFALPRLIRAGSRALPSFMTINNNGSYTMKNMNNGMNYSVNPVKQDGSIMTAQELLDALDKSPGIAFVQKEVQKQKEYVHKNENVVVSINAAGNAAIEFQTPDGIDMNIPLVTQDGKIISEEVDNALRNYKKPSLFSRESPEVEKALQEVKRSVSNAVNVRRLKDIVGKQYNVIEERIDGSWKLTRKEEQEGQGIIYWPIMQYKDSKTETQWKYKINRLENVELAFKLQDLKTKAKESFVFTDGKDELGNDVLRVSIKPGNKLYLALKDKASRYDDVKAVAYPYIEKRDDEGKLLYYDAAKTEPMLDILEVKNIDEPQDNPLFYAVHSEWLKREAEKNGYTVQTEDENGKSLKDEKGNAYWLVKNSKGDIENLKIYPVILVNNKKEVIELADIDRAFEAQKLKEDAVARGYIIIENPDNSWTVFHPEYPLLEAGLKLFPIYLKPVKNTQGKTVLEADGSVKYEKAVFSLWDLGNSLGVESVKKESEARGIIITDTDTDEKGKPQQKNVKGDKVWDLEHEGTKVKDFYPYKKNNKGEIVPVTLQDIEDAIKLQKLIKDVLEDDYCKTNKWTITKTTDARGYGTLTIMTNELRELKRTHGWASNFAGVVIYVNLNDPYTNTVSAIKAAVVNATDEELAGRTNGVFQQISHPMINRMRGIINNSIQQRQNNNASPQHNSQNAAPQDSLQNVSQQPQALLAPLQKPVVYQASFGGPIISFFTWIIKKFSSNKQDSAPAETKSESDVVQEAEQDVRGTNDLTNFASLTSKKYEQKDLHSLWDSMKGIKVTYYLGKDGNIVEKEGQEIAQKVSISVDGIRITKDGDLIIVYNEETSVPKKTTTIIDTREDGTISKKTVRSLQSLTLDENDQPVAVYKEEAFIPVNESATKADDAVGKVEYEMSYSEIVSNDANIEYNKQGLSSFAEYKGGIYRQKINKDLLADYGVFAQSLYFINEHSKTVKMSDGSERIIYIDHTKKHLDIDGNSNVTSVIGKVGTKDMVDHQYFDETTKEIIHLHQIYGEYYENKEAQRRANIEKFTNNEDQNAVFDVVPQRVFLGSKIIIKNDNGSSAAFNSNATGSILFKDDKGEETQLKDEDKVKQTINKYLTQARLRWHVVNGKTIFYDNQRTSLSHLDGVVSLADGENDIGYSFKGRQVHVDKNGNRVNVDSNGDIINADGSLSSEKGRLLLINGGLDDGLPVYEVTPGRIQRADQKTMYLGQDIQQYKLDDFISLPKTRMAQEWVSDEGKIALAFKKLQSAAADRGNFAFPYNVKDLRWAQTDIKDDSGNILYSTWQAYSSSSAEPIATVDSKGFIDFNVQYGQDANRITAGLRIDLNKDIENQKPQVVSVIVGDKTLVFNYAGNTAYVEARHPEGYLLSRTHLAITNNEFFDVKNKKTWEDFLVFLGKDFKSFSSENFTQKLSELTTEKGHLFSLANMEKFFYDDTAAFDTMGNKIYVDVNGAQLIEIIKEGIKTYQDKEGNEVKVDADGFILNSDGSASDNKIKLLIYTGAELAHRGVPSKTSTYNLPAILNQIAEQSGAMIINSDLEKLSSLTNHVASSKILEEKFTTYLLSESELKQIDWASKNIYFNNERKVVITKGESAQIRLYDSVVDFDGNKVAELDYEYDGNNVKKYTSGVYVGKTDIYGIADNSVSFLIKDGKQIIPIKTSKYDFQENGEMERAVINPYENVEGNFILFGYITRAIESQGFEHVDFSAGDILGAKSSFIDNDSGVFVKEFQKHIDKNTSATTKVFNSGEGEIVITLSGMPVDKNNKVDTSKPFLIQFHRYDLSAARSQISDTDRPAIPRTPIESFTYLYDPQYGLDIDKYKDNEKPYDNALFKSENAVPFKLSNEKGGVLYKNDINPPSILNLNSRLTEKVEEMRNIKYTAYLGDGNPLFTVFDYLIAKPATGALGTVISPKYYEVSYYDNSSKATYSFIIEKEKFKDIEKLENAEIRANLIREIEANVKYLRQAAADIERLGENRELVNEYLKQNVDKRENYEYADPLTNDKYTYSIKLTKLFAKTKSTTNLWGSKTGVEHYYWELNPINANYSKGILNLGTSSKMYLNKYVYDNAGNYLTKTIVDVFADWRSEIKGIVSESNIMATALIIILTAFSFYVQSRIDRFFKKKKQNAARKKTSLGSGGAKDDANAEEAQNIEEILEANTPLVIQENGFDIQGVLERVSAVKIILRIITAVGMFFGASFVLPFLGIVVSGWLIGSVCAMMIFPVIFDFVLKILADKELNSKVAQGAAVIANLMKGDKQTPAATVKEIQYGKTGKLKLFEEPSKDKYVEAVEALKAEIDNAAIDQIIKGLNVKQRNAAMEQIVKGLNDEQENAAMDQITEGLNAKQKKAAIEIAVIDQIIKGLNARQKRVAIDQIIKGLNARQKKAAIDKIIKGLNAIERKLSDLYIASQTMKDAFSVADKNEIASLILSAEKELLQQRIEIKYGIATGANSENKAKELINAIDQNNTNIASYLLGGLKLDQ